MLVLGIDTSALEGSVALLELDGRGAGATHAVAAEASAVVSNAHGQSLLPMVERVLASAGVRLASVGLVAVGIGPGSFTGTRVAVATAKGLCIGAGVPLRGVDSFCAIAAEAALNDGERAIAVLDARKAEVYVAAVGASGGSLSLIGAPAHVRPEAIDWASLAGSQAVCLVGDGVSLATDAPALPVRWSKPPRARTIARLAAAAQAAAFTDEVDMLEPLYVRPPDITLPKRPPPKFSGESSF
jgi:tRNA threonylcarbamoyladenosine biosynthesis protein TsaB